MSNETFNYVLRRVFSTPPCSNEELYHVIDTYECAVNQLKREQTCVDAAPIYHR